MLTTFPRKSELTSKTWRLQFTPWLKTVFAGGRMFLRAHQWPLKILRTLCHSKIVNKSFKCEKFFISKTISRFVVPHFKSLRRIFALLSLFFLDMCEVLSLSHIVGKQLEIIFNDSSHCGHTHSHVLSHLSCRSLRIPIYAFLDSFIISFDQLVCGLPLLRCCSDVPSSLNLITTW